MKAAVRLEKRHRSGRNHVRTPYKPRRERIDEAAHRRGARRADRRLHLLGTDAPLPEAERWAAWRPELDRRRALLERGELETVDAREHRGDAGAAAR